MASTIENMLIGVGFDIDKASEKAVVSQLDSLAHKATQMGKKVAGSLAGAFGVHELTTEWSAGMKDLGAFSERFGVAASDVSAFDKALQKAGGSAGEFRGVISKMTSLQNLSAADKASMVAGVADKGISGAMMSVMGAKDQLDGFLKAADAMQGMSRGQQERFAETMGFTDAEVNLLKQGRAEIEKQVAAEKQLLNITPEMTQAGKEFDNAWQDLSSVFSEVFNHVALGINPALTKLMVQLTNLLSHIMPVITSGIDSFFAAMGDQIWFAIAAIAAMTTSGLIPWIIRLTKVLQELFMVMGFKKMKKVFDVAIRGLKKVGKVARMATPVGAALTGGAMLFNSVTKSDEEKAKDLETRKRQAAYMAPKLHPEKSSTVTVNSNIKIESDDLVVKSKMVSHSTEENERAQDALSSGKKA